MCPQYQININVITNKIMKMPKTANTLYKWENKRLKIERGGTYYPCNENLNQLTFSGIIEAYFVTDKSCVRFFCGFLAVLDSILASTTLAAWEKVSDELFFLRNNSSFKFKVTSPLVISTFLTTTPDSLQPQETH